MWSAAAMIAAMFMASTLVTPLYVLYQQAFGFSTVALTVIYSTYVIGNLLALLFLARISDQLGRRRVILAAIAVAGVSSAFFLFAASTAWLYWARMLSGVPGARHRLAARRKPGAVRSVTARTAVYRVCGPARNRGHAGCGHARNRPAPL
jgi:MFS family permease